MISGGCSANSAHKVVRFVYAHNGQALMGGGGRLTDCPGEVWHWCQCLTQCVPLLCEQCRSAECVIEGWTWGSLRIPRPSPPGATKRRLTRLRRSAEIPRLVSISSFQLLVRARSAHFFQRAPRALFRVAVAARTCRKILFHRETGNTPERRGR